MRQQQQYLLLLSATGGLWCSAGGCEVYTAGVDEVRHGLWPPVGLLWQLQVTIRSVGQGGQQLGEGSLQELSLQPPHKLSVQSDGRC